MSDFIEVGGTKMPTRVLGMAMSEGADSAKNAVVAALKAGFRHIDCAQMYGNEAQVGEALQDAMRSGIVKREDLYITSKMWITDMTKKKCQAAVLNSLAALKLSYIDLYLIHWPAPASERGEPVVDINKDTWETLVELRKQGLVKQIGVANYSIEELKVLMATSSVAPVVNQVECHPSLPQFELRKFQKEHNIAMMAYSSLGFGLTHHTGSSDLDNPVVKKIAKDTGKSAAQICIRWGLQHGMAVLSKSANADRIKANYDVMDFALTNDQMEELNGVHKSKLRRCCNPGFRGGMPVFPDNTGF